MTPCKLWTKAKTARGYGAFKRAGRLVYAHRDAWEKANGRALRPGEHVCHTCDTPACIEPAHLFVGSRDDNMRDMVAKGRQVRGEGRAIKLTDAAVRTIRRLAGRLPQTEIAELFGCSPSMVSMVISRRRWSHV